MCCRSVTAGNWKLDASDADTLRQQLHMHLLESTIRVTDLYGILTDGHDDEGLRCVHAWHACA